MPLQEHSMFVQVLDLDDRLAPFIQLRVDIETNAKSGGKIVTPLAAVDYKPGKKDPYLFQYKLKNPAASLWLVLVDENGESKKKVFSHEYRYVFRSENEAIGDDGPNATTQAHQTKIVNITNHYAKEVTMARTVISGQVSGSILNLDSTLTNVTQKIETFSQADQSTKEELQKLVSQLFDELKKIRPEQQELAEAVAAQTNDVMEKAKQDKPNKTLLKIAIDGLKSAA